MSHWRVARGVSHDGTDIRLAAIDIFLCDKCDAHKSLPLREQTVTPAIRNFIEFFGALGPRWGLDANGCRVHAYLYLMSRGIAEAEMAEALGLAKTDVANALAYLHGYRMVERAGPSLWQTGSDPWNMLLSGLEERRRREIGPALAVLRDCQARALADGDTDRAVGMRIGKLLALVEDLAAIDAQARRLSPQLLRGIVGVSGRAARFIDRAFGTKKGEKP
jgi:DNA-binding transcriptional regulator GbsR (MarR family)